MSLLQKIFQGVELIFPELLVEAHPLRCGLQRLGVEAAAAHTSILMLAEQAGMFQYAQMLGNGGQGNAKGAGQLADRRFAQRQAGQDGAPRGVGKGSEGGIQRGLGILNHMV